MSTMTGNPTYNLTAMLKDEILQNHHSVMKTFGIALPEEILNFRNCNGFLNSQESVQAEIYYGFS